MLAVAVPSESCLQIERGACRRDCNRAALAVIGAEDSECGWGFGGELRTGRVLGADGGLQWVEETIVEKEAVGGWSWGAGSAGEGDCVGVDKGQEKAQ